MPSRIQTIAPSVLEGAEAAREVYDLFGFDAPEVSHAIANEMDIVHSGFSEFDAIQMRGTMRYNGAVKGLRIAARRSETQSTLAWAYPPSLPTVLRCASRNIDLAVYFGDAATGMRSGHPTNAYRKGESMSTRVRANRELFPNLYSFRLDRVQRDLSLWVLLLRCAGTELRAELSLPANDDGHGHISGWSRRLILPTVPLIGTPLDFDDSPDDLSGESIDVPVRVRED